MSFSSKVFQTRTVKMADREETIVAGGRNPATLPAGTPVTVRLVKPATVTVDEQ